jgi:hypothetical protein
VSAADNSPVSDGALQWWWDDFDVAFFTACHSVELWILRNRRRRNRQFVTSKNIRTGELNRHGRRTDSPRTNRLIGFFWALVESMGGEAMMITDFTRTVLTNADLRGTDLRAAIGLTVQQVGQAITDEDTKLPDYLKNEYLKNELAKAMGLERTRL